MSDPLVVAIYMGYGHLRAAYPIADALDVPVLHADRAPLADASERRRWARARSFHEVVSRVSQLPGIGRPFELVMDAITHIPPFEPGRDRSKPTLAVRYIDRLAARGVGRGMLEQLRESGSALFTTFYTPVAIADRAGHERTYCLVTDCDINRVWVQADPSRSRAIYFAPSERAKARLATYGIRPERVQVTGFPLPEALLGGRDLSTLRRNLAARLVRLDPSGAVRDELRAQIEPALGTLPAADGGPPLVTFAVGGAGAQVGLADEFVPALRPAIDEGRLGLCLVAGVRAEVYDRLRETVRAAGLEGRVEIVFDEDIDGYFRRFDAVMARTDVLWTKPSEVTFFAALGLPLVLSRPVGAQEVANREWALSHGAGRDQGDPAQAGCWLLQWLSDGTLARSAWRAFKELPKEGTYRIAEELKRLG